MKTIMPGAVLTRVLQTQNSGHYSPQQVLLTVGIGIVLLLALTLAGFLLIRTIRRRYTVVDQVSPLFTLAELRRLHQQGQLTDDEYARARDAMINQVRKTVTSDSASTAKTKSSEVISDSPPHNPQDLHQNDSPDDPPASPPRGSNG